MSTGKDVAEYFPHVVKNISSDSLAVKKLVYTYILQYAEQEPDLSLLSINTFQKDLNDPSPILRSTALRVLASIKVPLITPIGWIHLIKLLFV
jgi:AP-3 complex subunit beta